MTYSLIACLAVIISLAFDLFIAKTSMIRRRAFWTSYAIILPFQLITNWWLTSRNIVIYSDGAIWGLRIASAPIEDLLFGFSLVLAVISSWVYWGRKL